MSTTLGSSNPSMIIDGFASGMPRVFACCTTSVSSAIITAGFFAGMGYGGRSGHQAGMRVGDLLLHTQVTTAAEPVRATLHVVTGSTADQASTSASTGWGANFNVTVATAT